MTPETLSELIFLRITGGQAEEDAGIYLEAIQSVVPAILDRFSDRAYKGKIRAKLEKSYTPNLVSGEVDLSAVGFADLIFSSIPTAYMTYDSANGPIELQFYDNPRDLDYPHPAGYYYCSLIADKLRVKTEAAQSPDNAQLTIVASRRILMPAQQDDPIDVPAEYQDMLIDIGVELATESNLVMEVQREADKPAE